MVGSGSSILTLCPGHCSQSPLMNTLLLPTTSCTALLLTVLKVRDSVMWCYRVEALPLM